MKQVETQKKEITKEDIAKMKAELFEELLADGRYTQEYLERVYLNLKQTFKTALTSGKYK